MNDVPTPEPGTPAGGLRRPAVDAAQAARIASALYGVVATATELGSNQDRNFLLMSADARLAVLKVDNQAFSVVEIEAQNLAIERLAEAGVPVARVLPGLDGYRIQRVSDDAGTEYGVRLFEHLAGGYLIDSGYLSPEALAGIGALAGEVSGALAGFEHPGLDRQLQWDMRRALAVVEDLLPAVGDEDKALRVWEVADRAEALLAPLRPFLPLQPIHGDLTDDNIIAALGPDGRPRAAGVIDFGDLAIGWRVAELAVTCSSLLHHNPDDPLTVLEAVRAFHERFALSRAEAAALWPLIVQRAAVLVASGWQQVALEADNEYAAERMDGEWSIFEAATSLPLEVGVAAVLDAVGFPAAALENVGELLMLPEAYVLDLGVESPLLDAGKWLGRDAEDTLGVAALRTHDAVVLPYGVPRLTRTRTDARTAAETVPLGLQLYLNRALPLAAPWPAQLTQTGIGEVELRRADGLRLIVGGLAADPEAEVPATAPARALAAGDAFGEAPASYPGLTPPLSVRLVAPDAPEEVPKFTSPDLAPAWRRLLRDPASLFGLEPSPLAADPEEEQLRRNRTFSSAQERYYHRPPQIERGWRHHLVDIGGRSYVDLVNNVTGVGHGHPAVAAAATEQLRLLNTNSRFLYRSLAEYGERLVALAPEGLDTVMLVNSGTEAVDLALRLAWAATGRRTVVALREAYHGWSIGADAVTTSAYDNPRALASRPDWVHVADVPNPLRGTHRGLGAGVGYAEDLAADLARLDAEGRPVAGFICEPILGNAGGVLPPTGYLAEAYAAVRAHGGLCIADEVQVGFGRTGEFWSFTAQGVVPDIIAIAKPMGNGYPIGGVITTRAIAEALGHEGMFFSSAGGSPVSCRVGLAVLDAMEAEGLERNARMVGAHLKARLEALGERHQLVAHVHGTGLYLGVELVRDRQTLEPAAAEAAAICERLLTLGVIVQPTSERRNVLKVKPPLCLTMESADFVVEALDHVLSTGW
ncbi:aminotransferase [Arthrobacter ginkgonis]|uniref:Aminotransferase n=1 Tax=Arthrobacter ginkgonis TaxID=1630594 RepID=A0ABP7CC09_9MICC